jgi:preprotein translocase subunit YajC
MGKVRENQNLIYLSEVLNIGGIFAKVAKVQEDK